MIKKVIIFFIVTVIFSMNIYSYEPPKIDDYITDDMEEILPKDILYEGENGEQSVNYNSVLSLLCRKAAELVKPVLKNLFSMLAVVIIAVIFRMLCQTLKSDGTKKTFRYITSLCMAVLLYKILSSCWESMSSLFNDINVFMNGVTPVTTLLYALGGNVTTSAVSNAGMSIILTVFQDICYYGIKPVLQICFGFCIVSCISGSVDLKPVARFVRTTYTSILIFTISTMTCILTMQNMLSASNDSLAMRTVRFAAGTAVPLVGGALGEATATVASGLGVIKTSFGILAILALCVMVLPVVFSLWINKLAFSLSGTVCSIFGLSEEGELISSAGELLNFALAITVSVSVMFVIVISLFCNAACSIA